MKRIVCCRTDAIGDVILTLPVIRSIKDALPDARVTMLVSEYTAQLVANEKYIDRVQTIPGRELNSWREIKGLADQLRKDQTDTIIYFYPRLSLALAGRMGGITYRIGTSRRGYSFLFNSRTILHRRESGKHELDLNYELVKPHFPELKFHEPSLTVTEQEIIEAKALLQSYGLGNSDAYVVVHSVSRGSAPNWSTERYLTLASELTRSGFKVVLTGSAKDRPIIEKAADKSNPSLILLAGKSNLGQLKGIIKNAALVISGSTGPIHIASAVGTFAVGIYPPVAALSPVRWGPRGGSNKLFVPHVDSKSASGSESMDSITIEMVSEFVFSHLRADNKTGAPT